MHKRGQVGQTMTWMVATIIILVLAFIFVYITGALASVKSVIGLDVEYLSNEDTGIGTQQMLFAILEKDVGGLIKVGDFASVSTNVRDILSDFENEGVECNFVIEGKVNLGDDSGGNMVSINLHGEEVKLRC